jgi:hypothetical protein
MILRQVMKIVLAHFGQHVIPFDSVTRAQSLNGPA